MGRTSVLLVRPVFFGGSIFRVSELIYNEKNIFLIIVSPRILFNDDTSYLTVLPHLIKFKFHLRKSAYGIY